MCVSAAFLFQGIGFFDVGLAVMAKNWNYLLDHLILLDPQLDRLQSSEKIALLKSRLQPIR